MVKRSVGGPLRERKRRELLRLLLFVGCCGETLHLHFHRKPWSECKSKHLIGCGGETRLTHSHQLVRSQMQSIDSSLCTVVQYIYDRLFTYKCCVALHSLNMCHVSVAWNAKIERSKSASDRAVVDRCNKSMYRLMTCKHTTFYGSLSANCVSRVYSNIRTNCLYSTFRCGHEPISHGMSIRLHLRLQLAVPF